MKYILRKLMHWSLMVLGAAALLLVCFGLFITGKGYLLYRQALEAESVAQKIEEVRSIPGYTPLDQLPSFYIQAVLAAEDYRFYSHPGFDVIAIGRALWNDLLAGSFVQGGSTITQQLAKNLWFTQEKRLIRKVAELFMALELEHVCTKHEILELYVNSIYFGSGNTGIGQAAKGYYGLTPDQLSQAQCAMLAGIPNAPSAYALDEFPELAAQRQRQVLEQMVRRHTLTAQQADTILAAESGCAFTGRDSRTLPDRVFALVGSAPCAAALRGIC